MSDRYKDEIEEILEGSPNLPDQLLTSDQSTESFKAQLVSSFFHFRVKKIGSMPVFSILIGSVIFFALFLVTKVILFAVIGLSCLIVSYLATVWPTNLRRPGLYFNLSYWFNKLRNK